MARLMTIDKWATSALLLCSASICYANTSAPHVQATIKMLDPSSLEVSYQVPPSCTGLVFVNDGISPDVAADLRADWTPADDCTRIDSSGLVRTNPTCTSLRVRVPATQRALDRVYPWAYPIDNGFYLHTMAYAVTPACGAVDWRFTVPGGTIVMDGVISPAIAERSAAVGGGNYMPVILQQQASRDKRLYMDARFTPQGKAFVIATLATVERELRFMFPGLPFTMPYTLATVAPEGETWGDVANLTVMRLHLAAEPKTEQQSYMQGFIAHEMAHLAQPVGGTWNDPWKLDHALLAEGGAEFLGWAVSARTGWATQTELRQILERAVTHCVLAAAGSSWKDIQHRDRGRAPYDCGMTFHAIGLAGGQSAVSALLRLRDYYRAAKLGESTDFARALECGRTPACTPRWLNRLGGSEAVEAVLLDYADYPGSILRLAPWTPPVLDSVRRRYVNRLMQLDCQNRVSVSYRDDFVRVGSGLRCRMLREGMEVVRAEGVSLFGGVQGLQASARACAERGRTILGLKDGTTVELACDKSAYVPAQLFSVDIDRVLALTK